MSEKIKQIRRGSVVGCVIFGFMGLTFGLVFLNSLYNRADPEFVWAVGSALFLAVSVLLAYALTSSPSDRSPYAPTSRVILLLLLTATTAVVLSIGYWVWVQAVTGAG